MFINLIFPKGSYVLENNWLGNQIKERGLGCLKFIRKGRVKMIVDNVIIPVRSFELLSLLEISDPGGYSLSKYPPEHKKTLLERSQDTLEELKKIKLPELD
jgi:hypothetical protein